MMSASVAGRYPSRARVNLADRRRRVEARRARLPLAAISVSAIGHVVFVLLAIGVMVWSHWHQSKVYVVNLVPMVAAVGSPTAPAPNPSLPTRPAPALPSRAPTPTPTPEPRERAVREAPKLPEPSLPAPKPLPTRSALVRPGEKELPSVASPTLPQRVERPEKVDRAVESRPAPVASKGLPTGSPAGVGALSLEASDFPYAWYLRQVVQKITDAWDRQNLMKEPDQPPTVIFEIKRDGSIGTPRIEKSSGNSLYDQAALRAIVEASPFPPLPQDWSKPTLVLGGNFALRLKRG